MKRDMQLADKLYYLEERVIEREGGKSILNCGQQKLHCCCDQLRCKSRRVGEDEAGYC